MMRFARILIITAAAVAIASTPAAAQVQSGLHEVGVQGAFDRANDEFTARVTRINFDGYYGFFVRDRLEIGPAFTISKNGQERVNSALSGFVDVHFGGRQAVPYLEAAYGQYFGDNRFDGDPTFALGAAGVKWFFADGGGALNVSAFYRRTFFDVGGARNFATGVHELGAKVGVAIYFGR